MSELFDGITRRGPVPALVGDTAFLQAMLDTEAALARASARAGLFPAAYADAITAACRAGNFDLAALGRDAVADANPVIPLVRALTAQVHRPAAGVVHLGATSQDILDTATMLVARQALTALEAQVGLAAGAAATLAEAHRATPMAARTLGQQALPTTFGAKAAGWLSGLDDAIDTLQALPGRLAAQFGGAAGTTASVHPHGPEILAGLAAELGLADPGVPWHTNRSRLAQLAGALGVVGAALAKPARDVILLSQTEIGEVSEGAPGGSSTMPHKQNPVAAIATLAAATEAPGLVATVLAAAAGHEHERAAGAWHAEWRPLRELFGCAGSAAAWLTECLSGLEVHPDRMQANLDLTGGLLLAERVTAALAPHLGRLEAHHAVARAARAAATIGCPLIEMLAAEPALTPHLGALDLTELLDPAGYLGAADTFVERALLRHGPA